MMWYVSCTNSISLTDNMNLVEVIYSENDNTGSMKGGELMSHTLVSLLLCI